MSERSSKVEVIVSNLEKGLGSMVAEESAERREEIARKVASLIEDLSKESSLRAADVASDMLEDSLKRKAKAGYKNGYQEGFEKGYKYSTRILLDILEERISGFSEVREPLEEGMNSALSKVSLEWKENLEAERS
ncbi:hypothetical protein AKJ66_03755 [candidate division MSBL1 archaeon SCGC-AAA259E22]|uniref:Uncharacterized protein n=1 Tax=candidate division MSBL1 archaeon SCGC-AAA259E22 TaxID=1698265 RepID=A0A133UEK8_9EURY|nr:hypothetical protein AKJ66_03755 [candidate division MSBL1 archaeon SCGC-AAA259E22]